MSAEPAWRWRSFQELTPDELYAILRLRAMVFVVEQRCAYNDLDGYDRSAYHLFRGDGEQIVAYLRVIPPGVRYAEPSIGRVVTHPDVRGQGAGYGLMREAMARVEALFPGVPVRIGAQRRLERFYQTLGFVTSGDPYDEDGIEHVEMLRPGARGLGARDST